MLKAGLTGGLASGKSFVGSAFADLGCHLIEADQLGHQVLALGGAAHDAVVRELERRIAENLRPLFLPIRTGSPL